MINRFLSTILAAALIASLPCSASAKPNHQGTISGSVSDSLTGEPLPHSTIRALDLTIGLAANDDGRFRIKLPVGEHRIKVSHIGFHSKDFTVTIATPNQSIELDVQLNSLSLILDTITVFPPGTNAADLIIKQAIERKQEILNRVSDYTCEAYTKLALADADKDTVERIFMITETQSTVSWRKPNQYKEVITARRQTANIDADENLVSVGGIDNFNSNRVEIGEYSVVAPTATDAFDHYRFFLIDTLYIDTKAVFLIEIEPKNPNKALFVGDIQIADSTFDVVAVDVTGSAGMVLPMIEGFHYQQRLSPVWGDYWMPSEISFDATVEFKAPIPGVPNSIDIDYRSSFHSFTIDETPEDVFDEYALIVDPGADDVDSAAWDSAQFVPLTAYENRAYRRIDSVESAPRPFGKKLAQLGLFAGLIATGAIEIPPDFFRFNRVEGAYLGTDISTLTASNKLRFNLKTGYAFSADRTAHEYSAEYRLSKKRNLWIGSSYKNRFVRRESITTPGSYNPTYLALFSRIDPNDYYLEKGVNTWISLRPVHHTHFRLKYSDLRQRSASVNTDYSFFSEEGKVVRPNPSISSGTMRSIDATLAYDSRDLIRQKGKDSYLLKSTYTRISLTAELSDPGFIDSDFDYRKYSARLLRRQRTLGFGVTTFSGFVGGSDGTLPPQRYFTADFGNTWYHEDLMFATMDETNFSGTHAASVYFNHDFDRKLFARTGIPLIKEIPFTLSAHGGAFWTEFRNQTPSIPGETVFSAPSDYTELGFGVGNLTPFMAPINLAVWFTWQTSKYDTKARVVSLGVKF